MSLVRPPRLIRATKPFFHLDRTVTPEHDPFEVEHNRAQDLIDQGIAEAVVILPPPMQNAIAPAQSNAQRATSRRQ